jgi:hypothetical protein
VPTPAATPTHDLATETTEERFSREKFLARVEKTPATMKLPP